MYTSEIPVTKKRAQDATAKIEKLRLKRIRRIRHKQQEGPPPSESMGWLIYPRNLFMAIYRGPITPFITGFLGPPCGLFWLLQKNLLSLLVVVFFLWGCWAGETV